MVFARRWRFWRFDEGERRMIVWGVEGMYINCIGIYFFYNACEIKRGKKKDIEIYISVCVCVEQFHIEIYIYISLFPGIGGGWGRVAGAGGPRNVCVNNRLDQYVKAQPWLI